MPITSPPQSYQLDRVGTSGRSVGPQLAIVDEKGRHVSRGEIGRIAVQGPPNFHGYEGVEVKSFCSVCHQRLIDLCSNVTSILPIVILAAGEPFAKTSSFPENAKMPVTGNFRYTEMALPCRGN